MKNDDQQTAHDERWPRGDALDRLLELDEVRTPSGLDPSGLAQRALEAARASEEGERGALEPRPARRLRARRTWVPATALAAAAALLLVFKPWVRGGGDDAPMDSMADLASGPSPDAQNLSAPVGPPSAALLAALPELEAYDFLVEDLDPLEADALFLLDDVDPLILDLLLEDS